MARVRGIKQPHPLGSVASRAGVSQLTAASGATTSSGGVKISALPAASVANTADQFEVNQGGTSRRVTVSQVATRISALVPSLALSPQMFGATGDGIADDTVSVQAALEEAAATGLAVDMSGAFTYLVSQVTVPDGVVMVGANATIRLTDTLVGSAVAIVIGVAAVIETLNVTIAGTGTATDIISIGSATRIGTLSIVSTAQRSPGGITTKGQDVRIDYLKSVNFDRPFHAYNGPASGAPTTGLYLGYADITSYVRGLKFSYTYGFHIGGYHLRGRSPNASVTPGHNGILIDGCSDWTMGPGMIENAGEHAFRIGGASDGGVTRNARIGHLTAIQPGGCAFKIAPGGVGELASYIIVEGVTGTDCGETTGASSPENRECVRISSAQHITFEGPIVANKRNFDLPCSHVLMLSGIRYFSAPMVYAEDYPSGAIVVLEEEDSNPGPVEYISINGVIGQSSAGAAISSHVATYAIGNIAITSCKLFSNISGQGIVEYVTPASISGPVSISGTLFGSISPAIVAPDDPLVTMEIEWSGMTSRGRRPAGFGYKSVAEFISAPFVNDTTPTYLGGPYINSSALSTAGTGNYGAGLFGSRLGSSRRGWGVWPVQTGTGNQVGVIIGVGDPSTTANENLRLGLTIGHRGALTTPCLAETVVAPGAGYAKLVWVPGTTAGSAKLIAYAGTSTTPTVIVDNVGSGV